MDFGGVGKTIVGVGSALVDILLEESEEFLAGLGAPKGGMQLVDFGYIQNLLGRSGKSPKQVPGGSACNTIVGVAALGGPARFVGKRGSDELGKTFEDGLRGSGVEPVLLTSASPTGRVLSVITPDAQRSMFTFLGASSEARADEISAEQFRDAAVVHLEGYLLFNHDLLMAALAGARRAGARVSLDLASFTVVDAHRDFLKEITPKYVDILIANEDEARAFTGLTDERAALEQLASYAEIAVVKIGRRGSLIRCDGRTTEVGIVGDGSAVDTTGAGDLWAAGLLYGLVHGMPIDKCGQLAAACGYEVCRVVGAHIPSDGWKRIRKTLAPARRKKAAPTDR